MEWHADGFASFFEAPGFWGHPLAPEENIVQQIIRLGSENEVLQTRRSRVSSRQTFNSSQAVASSKPVPSLLCIASVGKSIAADRMQFMHVFILQMCTQPAVLSCLQLTYSMVASLAPALAVHN